MAGIAVRKDGIASLAYVPAIHALLCSPNVDARGIAVRKDGVAPLAYARA